MRLVNAITGVGVESSDSPSHRVKAVAWARVSTDMQDEKGLSLPQQMREIRQYAERQGYEIVAEYSEIGSAFQRDQKRTEFYRMISEAEASPDVSVILVHDFSRFSRDSVNGKALYRQLREKGIRVVSLNDPDFDPETVAGVWMEAVTFAKSESYSREIAFHTRKGCRANLRMRDPESGWCYKNGGQAPFGYKSIQVVRGEERRGHPIIKGLWVLDDTLVKGRPVYEWAQECLMLAAGGASMRTLADFCNENGIPGRRKQYWGPSTWYEMLRPFRLLEYCGTGIWNVHRKDGSERPHTEWEIEEDAHPPLISEAVAFAILEARRTNSGKGFDRRSRNSRKSTYLLSGGLFICERCGGNMVGFGSTDNNRYYRCASHAYRRGLGCGPGVLVRQSEIEGEVIDGLRELIAKCSDPSSFTRKVNEELHNRWGAATGYDPEAERHIERLDRKLANLRSMLEEEEDAEERALIRRRIQEVKRERESVEVKAISVTDLPQIDVKTVLAYRDQLERTISAGTHAQQKDYLRKWVKKVVLVPEDLKIRIDYQLPEALIKNTILGAEQGAEDCNTRGSGGRRLRDRERLFAVLLSHYPVSTLKMPV